MLVSTGAGDWLESNGSATKTDGGYLVSARKHFASQSTVGDVLVTSAPFMDEVLHFPVPMNAAGVTVLNDWRALGMRATVLIPSNWKTSLYPMPPSSCGGRAAPITRFGVWC